VALAILLVLGGGGYAVAHWFDDQVHGQRGSGEVKLDVRVGASVSDIADQLHRAGLIDSTLVFELYVRAGGHRLEAGHYLLDRPISMAGVVAILDHSAKGRQVTLTVPEGFTDRQIADLLHAKGLFSADAYIAAQQQGTWLQDFLVGHQPGTDLEGYLFPDTYFFAPDAVPKDVIQAQLDRFGEKMPSEIRARAADHQVTFAQAVVLASLIEREAKLDLDRPQIAAVLYNRLARGMPLEVDATILYALGRTSGDISEDDKKVNSPENTYLHIGVPPRPIANPGLTSLQAVLTPATNDYLYYFTDSAGKAHYSKSFQQHKQCLAQPDLCPTAG
jgi:UPF0755 protein